MIDLNQAPRDQEGGTSASETAPPIQASQPVHAMIDVDAIEDDVVESSASDFAEVKFAPFYSVMLLSVFVLLKVNLFFLFGARL